MTNKIVFLDIDGTLVDEKEQVPESAQIAIKKAMLKGHKIYLCTGRSKPEIYPHIMDIGFDGIIGAGGGYVESHNKVVFHKQVSEKHVKHMVDFFVEKEMDFYLESNGGLYGNKGLKQHLLDILPGEVNPETHPFMKKIIFSDEGLYRSDVNKACFLENKNVPFQQIKKEFDEQFEVIHCTVPAFGENSGELTVPGINKAVAIEALLNFLKVDKEQTVAVGDGMNDKEMLEYCEVGIAMGNGKEDLKAIADFVTTDLKENGIYRAFEEYNLI